MLSAEVPVEMDEKLKKMAIDQDVSKSHLIRRMLRLAIEKFEKEQGGNGKEQPNN